MSLYTKARKYIDMDRVKELREEKIKRKKIADEIREQIIEELKNLNNPEFSNWRYDIDEGMTSSGVFQTTLPATGDVDLITVDVSSAGTWDSSSGGTTVSGSGLNFDQRPSNIYSSSWNLSNLTTEIDATQVNNLKVSVTTGTGVDTPFAANPLTVEWVSSTDFGTLGTFSAGGGTQVFTLPKEANVKNLVLFYSVSGNGTSYRTYTDGYLVGQNIYGGAMDSDMSQQGMIILDAGATPNTSPSYPTVDDVKALYGFSFWIDALTESRVTALRNGSISGPMPPSWGGVVPPGQVSGGFTRQDQIDIYNQIHNLYASYNTRASNLYTVTATNFQRRTPMNVFVGLDSPDAAAFIRSEPIMAGLSAEDRKKKLMDMLDAGDEYLLKQLGIVGSSARPSDTTMPDSWDQAAAQQGPMPTGPSGYKKPGSYDPNKIFNLAPGSLPSPNIPYTGPGRSNVPGTTDYGNVAATYGGEDAANRKKIRDMLNNPKDPFYQKPTGPGQPGKGRGMGDRWLPSAKNKQTSVVTHYEPEGETIMEKKKKSFKDLTSKIPGYYEGKPAPLGFPMEEPPKMKNGFHPDLVDGKKVSDRFNRLDPQSAKAMPPTGNPHIDKKVRAAAKKPK
tara:strand:- start:86 stop:1936 length:1851 start_codon:yes stop_codon:yes gene_type:complete